MPYFIQDKFSPLAWHMYARFRDQRDQIWIIKTKTKTENV